MKDVNRRRGSGIGGCVRVAAALMPGEEIFSREFGTAFLYPSISQRNLKHEMADGHHNGVASR